MYKNELQEKNVNINELVLGWDNPRLASFKNHVDNLDNVTEKDKQDLLMYYMVLEFRIEELLSKMLLDWDYSMMFINQEPIYIYINEVSNFIVKEGNRRVTTLKIINNPMLIDDIVINLSEKFYNDLSKFDKFEVKANHIKDILQKNKENLRKDFEISVITSSNNVLLDKIIRDIHIDQKEKWEFIDRSINDYNIVMTFINKGFTIENALKEACDSLGFTVDHYHRITAYKKMKSRFENISFYNFFLDLSKKYHKEKIYAERMVNKFLPIVEVLAGRMKKDYNYTLDLSVENNELKSILKCNDLVAPETSSKAYLDIIIYILKENLSHTKFKTKDNLKVNVIDVLGNENVLMCFETKGRAKPVITLKESKSRIKIYNNTVNLYENIHTVKNSKGIAVDKKLVDIYIDGVLTGVINKIENPKRINVEYKYIDDFGEKVSERYTIDFYSPPASRHPGISSLSPNIEKFNYKYDVEINEHIKQYIYEINMLSVEDHSYTISSNLRPIFDNCINELKCIEKKFSNQNPSQIIKHIKDFLRKKIKDEEYDTFTFQFGFSEGNFENDYLCIDYGSKKSKYDGFVHLNQAGIDSKMLKEELRELSRFLIVTDMYLRVKKLENENI